MKQSHIHDPPKPIDGPLCPKCGWGMWLARIEQPTSLITINARLNVRDANNPKR
jgi:hypothetical protein